MAGDFAMWEADGTITLLGRGSVCINSGGEKIFPEEVESALKSHPDVFDALVVGAADERWGQRVAAVVQPRAGASPTLDELAAHCRTRIAGYKVPRELHLVDDDRALAERQARLPVGAEARRDERTRTREHPAASSPTRSGRARGCPPSVSLPWRERLVAEGLDFTNHWTHSSPCSPSRATMMTGPVRAAARRRRQLHLRAPRLARHGDPDGRLACCATAATGRATSASGT